MGAAVGRWFHRRRRIVLLVTALVALAGVAGYWGWQRWKTAQLVPQAEQALADRDYPRARELLEQYLTERPGDTHARLLAARTARRMKLYREAREHLHQCSADGGDAEQIEIEELLIEVQLGNEQPVSRLRERARRDDDLALIILEVLIQHDLDTYQLGSALDGFTRYLARRPDDLQALLGRGFVWERFLNFSDALEDYRKAVAGHPESDRARLKLADTLLIVGTPEEALTHYRWLAERWPERPPVRLGLARCYRRLGQPEESVRLLDGLLKEFPNHGETLWERGELELEQGRASTAEPLLKRAVRELPYDRRPHYALYRCLLTLDRPQEAETVNTRVKQLDADLLRLNTIRHEVMKQPNNAALRCEGGLLFLRNGEREEGIRWLRLALMIDPTCELARSALVAEGRLPKQP
ncbi:MAG: tetratricopeptide repeat protein [Planctomycetia bacterium]|nr:tetratricopeptide repeat protein [Planctomycetia bacterium]